MKKFLSLVLALIMTMSLVTISAGATEYRDLTDKDEIQYEEAVAVLNRIGVITGYEDGSFRPETELTRGAAAKIIVSLLIGPEAASNLPNNSAPYPDVPASHTFAGVISYCKTAKIISGYGDGTFKPGNSLTGFAFAKMLLGALGYKSDIEGFVDTGWTMNVAKVGNVTGLFDRLEFDGAAAVNRETACQLALNTLKATMVTYGGTTVVTGAQALAVQGTQAMYVTSNNREINANINRRVISAANNEMTLEFGEEHFKDLRLEHDKYDPAYDEYGHPSNEWSWKNVTIGTFKLPANFTFTKQMSHLEDTDATKEKAVGLRNYDTWSVDHRGTNYNWSSPLGGGSYTGVNSPFDDATQITINGWNARVDSKTGRIYDYDAGDFNGKSSKPTGVPTIAEIADLTDNGVTVEVYVCPVDADFITNVVVTRTQLMKVKRLGSDYVTLEDIEPDSRDPRKDSDLKKITGYNNFAIDVTENYDAANKNSFLADVKDSNYDAYNVLKDMKVGDYVAVVPYSTDNGKTWEVGEAYAPETVSGAFTKVDTYANVNKSKGSAVAITVGGTSYPINEWNKDMLDVTGSEIKATKKDVTLYLAKDGTVLWANEIGDSDAWMVVGDYYQATGTTGKVGWFVHGWTIGGAEVDLDLGTIRGDAERYAPGELVHYYIAEGGNGEYALEKPNYYGQNRYKDGTVAPEKARATLTSGEGVYEVSQYTIDADNSNLAKKYQINKRNGALAVENYQTKNSNPPTYWHTYTTDAAGVKTNRPTAASDENGVPKKTVNKSTNTLAEHFFDYSNLLYDGVKFIFVNFDAVNGEVETIDFKDGVQNVDYTDLIRYNTKWKNIGTNDGQKFVLSATEAYVNNKGVVKAVVVKADSSEADLSKIAVITDTPGDRNLQRTGAEGDRTNGLSYAKQYVTGPNFNMSEEKTGYFDKDYPIGTILVISEKDNIIVGKYFHSEYYNNGNPDAVYVNGITPLLRTDGKNSEAGFLIGQNGNTVTTLDTYGKLTETVANDTIVTDGSRTVQILTNKYVSGFDTVVNGEAQNLKGLIRVDGSTKFIDLRAINNDTIDNLGDLLTYDPATVRARVLVDGSVSTDLFRHAYVVIVEKAEGKKDSVAQPGVKISSEQTKLNETTKKLEATVGSQVVLTTTVTNALTAATGVSTTYQWYKVMGSYEQLIVGATEPVYVVNSVISGDNNSYKVVVTNTDTNRKDVKTLTASDTYSFVGVTGQTTDPSATQWVKFQGDATEMKGATVGQTGGSIVATNKFQAQAYITVPEYARGAASGSDIVVTADIYHNVEGLKKSNATATVTYTTGDTSALVTIQSDNNQFLSTDGAYAVIKSIQWKKVGIKILDVDNNAELYKGSAATVPSGLFIGTKAQFDASKAMSASEQLDLKYTSTVSAGKLTVAVDTKGFTVDTSATSTYELAWTTAGQATANICKGIATGEDWVTIKVTGLSKIKEKALLVLDANGGADPNLVDISAINTAGVDVSDLNSAITSATPDNLILTFTPDAVNTAQETPATITVGAYMSTLTDNPGYSVIVKGVNDGDAKTIRTAGPSGEVVLGTLTLTKDTTLKSSDITVTAESAPTVTSVETKDGFVVITFSEKMKMANSTDKATDLVTIQTDANSSMGGGWLASGTTFDGNKWTGKLAGTVDDNTDIIQIVAAKLVSDTTGIQLKVNATGAGKWKAPADSSASTAWQEVTT